MKITIRGRIRVATNGENTIHQYILVGLQEKLNNNEIVTITGNTYNSSNASSYFTSLIVDNVIRELPY